MFNETSYGLGDAAAVQRRLDAGKRVKDTKLVKFGLTAPMTTMPVARGPLTVPGGAGGGVMVDPLVPASESPDLNLLPTDTGESSGGFDIGGIIGMIPWWGYLLGAYFLLKKR